MYTVALFTKIHNTGTHTHTKDIFEKSYKQSNFLCFQGIGYLIEPL